MHVARVNYCPMHIARVTSPTMTSQHLIPLLICINQLMAGPAMKKPSEEKSEIDLIEARSNIVAVAAEDDSPPHISSGTIVLLLLAHFVAALVELAALAFHSTAIFILLLLGNIAFDSLALAHKMFAVVQPPHLNWIHDLVPQFLDSVLAYNVRLHSVLL